MLKTVIPRGNTPFWLNPASSFVKTVTSPPHHERAKKQIHAQNIVETSDFNETKLFELPKMRTIVLYMFNVDPITFKLKRS